MEQIILSRKDLKELLKNSDFLIKVQRASSEIANYLDGTLFTAAGDTQGRFEHFIGWSMYKFFDEYGDYYFKLFDQLYDHCQRGSAEKNVLNSLKDSVLVICSLRSKRSREYFRNEQRCLELKKASLHIATFLENVQRTNYQVLAKELGLNAVE